MFYKSVTLRVKSHLICLKIVLGLSISTATLCASSHGLSPQIQVAATAALAQKCKADQPQLEAEIDASFKKWEARNLRAVHALRIYGEGAYRKLVLELRRQYDAGTESFTAKNCRDLTGAMLSSEMDVVADASSTDTPPEVQAMVVIVLAQKCEDDQPQSAKPIEVSFARWQARNRQYIEALHRDGEEEYRNGLQTFRKSYDEGGPETKLHCDGLANALRNDQMDVVK